MTGARRAKVGSLIVVVAMGAAGLGAATESPSVAAEPAIEVGDGQSTDSRPDSVSAMGAARATGERVEDLSQGDESTRVFANPDGSWSADTTPGPQRVRDEHTGEWIEVDTNLKMVGDRLVPVAVPIKISLSGGGDRMFAVAVPVDGGASDELAWQWPTTLPEPVVEGSTGPTSERPKAVGI